MEEACALIFFEARIPTQPLATECPAKKPKATRATPAIFGTLLNIKPILSVNDEGAIYAVDKIRGHKKAVSRVVELFVKDYGDQRDINIAVCDCVNPEGAEEILRLMGEHFTIHEVVRTSIGAVVGTHVGPGTVATFIWPAE